MVIAPPVIALGLYGSEAYDDVAYSMLMLFAIFYLLHNSLRIDHQDTEGSSSGPKQQ